MSEFVVPHPPIERRRYDVASAPLRIIGAALCAYGMPVAARAFTEHGTRMGLVLQVLTNIHFPNGFPSKSSRSTPRTRAR